MKATKKVSRIVIAFVMSIAAAAAGLSATPAAASDLSSGLVAWYRLNETSGATAADSSGNGRDATVAGTASWNGGDGFTFSGGASSAGNAITLPNNLLTGLDDASIDFDVRVDPTLTGNWFMFNLGNSATYPNGTGYLFVTGKDASSRYRGTIATAGFASEQSAFRAGGLATSVWKHVTLTVHGGAVGAPGTSRLYEDGLLVASNTGITVKPSQIGEPDGTSTRNVIGRSAYSGDQSFKGSIRDFRIYDRALDAADAAALSSATSTAATESDAAALTLGEVSAVTDNLTLPTKGSAGSTITWASSDTGTISTSGAVTRPLHGAGNASVTLTATITQGAVSQTKQFDVTVLEEELDDAGKVRAALDAIVLVHADDVRGNLTLPDKGSSGTAFSWASSNTDVVSASGTVTRPAHGADPVQVTLTATGTLRDAQDTRDIVATVKPAPAPLDYDAYAFAYFAGESTDDGEKIYFASSKGNDPLDYDELNDGDPVLTSTLGEKGLRDPFIIRSHEGDRFYLLATDLKIFGGNNFGEAQESGSKSLMIWESTDLVNWSEQREVKVSSDLAGNTWAPESYYDEASGEYVVYWASNLYDTTDESTRVQSTTYNRMMYATTRDFVTFSDPQPWIDVKRGTGRGMIDATVVQDGDTFYRVVKDEASMTPRQEKSTDLRATVTGSLPTTTSTPGWQLVKEEVGVGQPNPWGGTFTNGEGPTIFRDNENPDRWNMFIDQPSYHGGQGYLAFETNDIASGNWTSVPEANLPSSPRHGTVLPVTQSELDALRGAYQKDLLVEGLDDVAVKTREDVAPELPAEVGATFADGSHGHVAVTWDDIAPGDYAEPGSFEVSGSVKTGASVRAKATVTVTDALDPTITLSTDPANPDGESDWWTTGPVKVTASGFDDREMKAVETSVDDGSWTPVEASEVSVLVAGDGHHSVRARATDASGNVSPVGSLDLKIDTTEPVSKATADTAARTVTFDSADETSGVQRVEFRTDTSDPWQSSGSSMSIGDEETAVQFRAVDGAGNAEQPNTITVPAVGQGLHDSLTVASVSTSTPRFGSNVTVAARVTGAGPTPTGSVRVLSGSNLVGEGVLGVDGRVNITVRTSDLATIGSHLLTVRYDGDVEYRASQDELTLVVSKATPRVSVRLDSSTVWTTQRAVVRATVTTSPTTAVTGSVRIKVTSGGKTYVNRLISVGSSGKVSLSLPKLPKGIYSVRVTYRGSATVEPSSGTARLTVKRR